jgi:hypothetical protein
VAKLDRQWRARYVQELRVWLQRVLDSWSGKLVAFRMCAGSMPCMLECVRSCDNVYNFLQMAAQLRERQLGDMLQEGTYDEGGNGGESEEDCASEGDCDSAEGEEGCESEGGEEGCDSDEGCGSAEDSDSVEDCDPGEDCDSEEDCNEDEANSDCSDDEQGGC